MKLLSSMIKFTIATPTYNRAEYLPNLYWSLEKQTIKPLEWIVVDDGSTDLTSATIELLRECDGSLKPRFYRCFENSGPHVALNIAIQLARGDWFVYVPSDDWLTTDALETFQELILGIDDSFCAVGGRCMRPDGTIPGKEFPRDPIDFNYAEGYFRWPHEKQAAIRTSILRDYPFPHWPGQYVPEGISWARMGLRYRMRFSNRPVRVFEPSIQKKEGSFLATRPAARGRAWFHTIMLVAGLKYWWHPRYLMMFPAIAKDLVKLYFFTLRNALSH